MSNAASPITIKKYANRRLYNTATSSYVTLDHLCQMVKDNEDFVVYDAKSGEDITRSVLTQIIVEEESKGGQNLLPIPFLRQLIGFYGDQLGGLVPKYLEQSMQAFHEHEVQMRQYMTQAFGGLLPFNALEAANKQNLAFFENAMKMFTPLFGGEGIKAAASASEATLEALQNQLVELQDQLAKATQPPKKK
jgi:polyhydroxyalkanoate synthesis repressor PhaR